MLTRRDVLMLNAALIGAIAASDGGSEEAVPQDLPYFGRYYGMGIFARQPGNTHVDSAGDSGVSHLFYAERTGTITHFRFQRRTGEKYSSGDGGTFTVEIRPANPVTKLPIVGSNPICQITGYKPGNATVIQTFPVVAFSTTGQVIAKQPYTLTWRNTGASPGSNYFSMNNHNVYSASNNAGAPETPPTGTDPRNVGASPVAVSGWSPVFIDETTLVYDYPHLTQNGVLRRHHGDPFFGVRYSDGIWAGFTFTSGTQVDLAYRPLISSGNMVRQRFRVSGANRVVDGVFIRAVRYNASGGNLVVTLESGPASDTSGNGTTIEQVPVAASLLFDVGADETGADEQQYDPVQKTPWIWVPFSTPRVLTVGQLYNLRLSAAGGFTSRFWVMIRGGDNYFGTKAVDLSWDDFEAGRTNGVCPIDFGAWWDSRGCQVTTDSGSTWSWFTPNGHQSVGSILFRCVTG